MNAFISYQSHWQLLLTKSLVLSSLFYSMLDGIFSWVQTIPNFMLCPPVGLWYFSTVIHLKNVLCPPVGFWYFSMVIHSTNIDQGGHSSFCIILGIIKQGSSLAC